MQLSSLVALNVASRSLSGSAPSAKAQFSAAKQVHFGASANQVLAQSFWQRDGKTMTGGNVLSTIKEQLTKTISDYESRPFLGKLIGSKPNGSIHSFYVYKSLRDTFGKTLSYQQIEPAIKALQGAGLVTYQKPLLRLTAEGEKAAN